MMVVFTGGKRESWSRRVGCHQSHGLRGVKSNCIILRAKPAIECPQIVQHGPTAKILSILGGQKFLQEGAEGSADKEKVWRVFSCKTDLQKQQ
jgi:hypothetical protein